MAWLAMLLPALASLGATAYSAVAANKKDKNGIDTTTIPLPPDIAALQAYANRISAANMFARAPSFTDYMLSGGKAHLPVVNPGMTPDEARKLKFVDAQGAEIPYFDEQKQTQLTPAQELFIGRLDAREGRDNLPARFFNQYARYKRLQELAGNPGAPAKKRARAEAKLPNVSKNLNKYLDEVNTGGQLGVKDLPDLEVPQYPRRKRNG